MGPIFKKLVKSDRGDKVAYIKLDLTDKITSAIAKEVAAGYGIRDIFRYSKGTGVIVLVDADTLEPIKQLTILQTAVEMAKDIDSAAARRVKSRL
jgi:hypothetical protein